MKRLPVFLFLVLMSFSLYSRGLAPVKDAKAFEERLSAATGKVKSIESRFVQNKYMDVFRETVRSEGVFRYLSPGRISMKYTSPVDYEIVISPEAIKTVMQGRETVVKGNPVLAQVSGMMAACTGGDLSLLAADFDMDYFESSTEYIVILQPKTSVMKGYISSMEIHVDKGDMSVNSLRINENETDYTEYVFTGKKFNTFSDESLFAL